MSLLYSVKLKLLFAILITVFFAGKYNINASEKWTRVTSKNFQLVGNADEKDIKKTAQKLEQFRLVLEKVFDKFQSDPSVPTTVIVFKDENSFKKFKPVENGKRKDWVAGFFLPGQDMNYIALSINSEEKQSYRIIFHEYTHYLINNNLRNSKIPAWLSEGLAGYYEKLNLENNRTIRLGEIDRTQIKLLKTRGFIPAESFFNTDNLLLERQNEIEVNLFYAQSWALVHYLFHGKNGARKNQLTDFTKHLIKKENPKQAFLQAFKADYQTIENELENYILQNSLQFSEINVENELRTGKEMISAAFSISDAKYFEGDLLFRLNRLVEAEELLRAALELDPKSVSANVSMGLLMSKKNDFANARKYLEKAVEFDPQNYLTHYNLAFVLSRETVDENGNVSGYESVDAEKMTQSLRKAIVLNPDFVESYNLFAFISLVQKDNIVEALEYLEKALLKSPENTLNQLRKSELLMLKEDFDASKALAKIVFESSNDEKMRQLAQKTLEKIENYKSFIERVKQDKQDNPYLIENGKILTEDELEKLQKRMEIDSINSNLRKLKIGEKRIVGKISKIECASKGVIYQVQSENQNLQFINKSFNGIEFFTYKIELKNGTIGCETDLSSFSSIITFKPLIEENSNSSGEIVSIEFVPDYFVFNEKK